MQYLHSGEWFFLLLFCACFMNSSGTRMVCCSGLVFFCALLVDNLVFLLLFGYVLFLFCAVFGVARVNDYILRILIISCKIRWRMSG